MVKFQLHLQKLIIQAFKILVQWHAHFKKKKKDKQFEMLFGQISALEIT